jgi:hypothetical protein
MHIHKAEILANLRSRGLDARAEWVDRTLPDAVDAYQNESLLRMLGIDAASMAPVEATTLQG